jgi:hypothetical protein
MKTLQDVAATYAVVPYNVAYAYVLGTQRIIKNSYTGWKKAPYLTGNLYRNVGSFNRPANMITQKGLTYVMSLNYASPGSAPNGAYYGQFVHNGYTTTLGNAIAGRPYAIVGASTPEVVDAVAEYQRLVVTGYNGAVANQIDVIMRKGRKK